MKRILFIIFFIGSGVNLIAINGNDSLYLYANEAYTSGDFEIALDQYREIEKTGFVSADLYYNMGNAAFRSNKLGYSILYYNKALKLDPSHEEAKNNLNYVSIYKEDKLDQVPEFFLRAWIKAAYKLFSLKSWAYIALVLFALLLMGVLIYIFSRRLVLKKLGFYGGAVCLLLFLFSFSAALSKNRQVKNPENAIIIAPSVVVKSSPSMSGNDLFILHEGTMVNIDESVSGWIEVRISDGRIGWVGSETLEII